MDDFNISSLHESKNEWCARLLTIFTPLIIDGYKSILDESIKLCKENNEKEKYLMTFQNFVSRIPKWNNTIIENEKKRIIEKSGCLYLEDLLTCVHIIQLKILSAIRVGQKQKKIDINIPKLDDFIHKAYINVARKVYKNVYLFELNSQPLQIQKYNRELEIIVQECILNTIRESIPVETILKAYMDETIEEDVVEEIKEQYIDEPIQKSNDHEEKLEKLEKSEKSEKSESENQSKINFDDTDYVKDDENNIISVIAPKTIERLEEISELRNQQRKIDEDEDEDEELDKITISNETIDLNALDINSFEEPNVESLPELLIDDIEILE